METTVEAYEGWAIVELMGHTKIAGQVSIGAVGAMPATRLDIYIGDAEKPVTQYLPNGDAVYRVTPTTEEVCRALSVKANHEPVAVWELPQLPQPNSLDCDDDDRQELPY